MTLLRELKQNIDKELKSFISFADKKYTLSKLSPELYEAIKDFLLRDGKRVRPILLILGYSGFSKKPTKNLYRCALSIELLHDFMLVHDDIMDKASLRRGKPTLHKLFDKKLSRYKNLNFTGEDLGIIAGDVIYSLALKAFDAIKVKHKSKENALNLLNDATIYTGSGQFLEFINMTKSIEKITKKDIYKVYDYKTSFYTFSCPLAMGASLANASKKEVEKLLKFGLYVGRAFQIKDDIIGTFGDKKKTGKSVTSDLDEGKRTILFYEAYRRANTGKRKALKTFLKKKKKTQKDFKKVKRLIVDTGSLDYAEEEISSLLLESKKLLKSSELKPSIKEVLFDYSENILNL